MEMRTEREMAGSGKLQNRVAVITGSTRGLGRAMAEAFAREGACVVVSSRTEAAVEATVQALRQGGGRAAGMACDVADAAQVEALAACATQEFGQIDVWVNNAGVSGPWARTLDVGRDEYLRVVETNILGGYYGSVTALSHMLPRRTGKILNLLGMGARGPAPFANAYGPSKAWLRSFTLALAREYRDSGVGIFAFAPGMVRTEMLTDLRVIGPDARHAARLLPFALRVLARPPEVAAARAVRIASAATDGQTGKVFETPRWTRLAEGLTREAWRAVTRRPAEEIPLRIEYRESRSSEEDGT
jgi:NAD(P)-dependent dehydrogenase (short-subunit alcohol dehydrogenase family)